MKPASRLLGLACLVSILACGRTELLDGDPETSGAGESFDSGPPLDSEGGGVDAGSDVDGGEVSTTSETSSGSDTTGSPCSAAYGDPGSSGEACCEGEVGVWPNGLGGGYCAPTPCSVDADCPLGAAADESSLFAMCLFVGDSGQKDLCALACKTDVEVDGCPPGSSCKPLSSPGWGVCTWP